MEWVETTGRTMEEAKEAALDELGVAMEDAEFKVLEEARSGLFGRMRQEARVRARVRPTSPRPKADRRDRRRKTADAAPAEVPTRPEPAAAPPKAAAAGGRARGGRRAAPPAAVADDLAEEVSDGSAPVDEVAPPPRRGGRSGGAPRRATVSRAVDVDEQDEQDDEQDLAAAGAADRRRGADVDDEPTLAEQAETVKEFLDGLVDAFGASGTTEVEEVDDDTLEARVVGDDLGLLIGPKGATLQAVQEITRTVLQRAAEPGRGARLRIDIGGYREHRREALARFSRQVADQVLDTGTPVALEPMNAPDRKVVHDTVNEIDGVVSSSDGEDPNRRVVISPE